MAWTTPVTYTVGQVLTAASLNTYLRDNTNYLKSGINLFGAGTAIVGTSPAVASNAFTVQAGRSSPTTAAGGGINIPFPVTFTTGLLTGVVTPEDQTTNTVLINLIAANCTTSALNGVVRNGSGTAYSAGTVIPVTWVAVGW